MKLSTRVDLDILDEQNLRHLILMGYGDYGTLYGAEVVTTRSRGQLLSDASP